MIRNFAELYQYRGLLWALTLRELQARYRASILGFMWTFLNPALNMLVYSVVFGVFMAASIEHYPYFLLSGLLPWIFFSTSVVAGTSSVSDRRDLLTKVRFPAQVLPATVVATNLLNFIFSLPLLFLLGAAYGELPSVHLVYLPVVLAVQTLLTLAVTYVLSAYNVAFRDLQHIVANVLQMLFFITPVLWKLDAVDGLSRLGLNLSGADSRALIIYANPLAAITEAYRKILYYHQAPELGPLVWVTAVSVVLMSASAGVFQRRREEFAELV